MGLSPGIRAAAALTAPEPAIAAEGLGLSKASESLLTGKLLFQEDSNSKKDKKLTFQMKNI